MHGYVSRGGFYFEGWERGGVKEVGMDVFVLGMD